MNTSPSQQPASGVLTIAVFGASGDVGRRLVAEGARRGHRLTAVSRREPEAGTHASSVTSLICDVENDEGLASVVESHDVIITALRPRDGEEPKLVDLTARVVGAALATGTRFIVVGGAAALTMPDDPSHTVLTAPDFLPDSTRAIAQACQDQHDWVRPRLGIVGVYACPPAMLTLGERTGTYRVGSDTLLVDDQGVSRVSMEDFAVALIDEAEERSHAGHPITVAY